MEQRQHRELHIPQSRAAESPAERGDCEPSPGWHNVLRNVYGEHSDISQTRVFGAPVLAMFVCSIVSAQSQSGISWQIDLSDTVRAQFQTNGKLTNIASTAFGPIEP